MVSTGATGPDGDEQTGLEQASGSFQGISSNNSVSGVGVSVTRNAVTSESNERTTTIGKEESFESSSNDNVSGSISIGSTSSRSRFERIQEKLRCKETRLSLLVKSQSRVRNEVPTLDDSHSEAPSTVSSKITNGDDKHEAVKALTFAAFKLQRQVEKKSDEANRLRVAINELQTTLKTKERHCAAMEIDLAAHRRSVKAHSDHIKSLCRELEVKNSRVSELLDDREAERDKVEALKKNLAAARKDFDWIRGQSIETNEQVEYFEYELLAKNDEIDRLHQELDQKLRRIVELEVDMDILDCRNALVVKGSDSLQLQGDKGTAVHGTTKSLSLSETHGDKRSSIRKLIDLGVCHKVEGDEAVMRSSEALSTTELTVAETMPTVDTFSSDSASSVTSSSVWNRPPRARKNGHDSLLEKYTEMVEQLRTDLSGLENKYKNDKYNSAKLVEKLRQENNEFLIKLVCMERKLEQKNPNDMDFDVDLLRDLEAMDNIEAFLPSDESSGSIEGSKEPVLLRASSRIFERSSKIPSKIHYMEQRIELLECERTLYQRQVDDLKEKCAQAECQAKTTAKRDKQAIIALAAQNESQARKITELEQRLHAGGPSKEIGKELAHYVASLEAKVKSQLSEITRLQHESDTKDKKIEALRSNAIERKVRQLQRRGDCHMPKERTMAEC